MGIIVQLPLGFLFFTHGNGCSVDYFLLILRKQTLTAKKEKLL